MAAYEVGLIIVGLAILGAVVLPRLLEEQPVSFPMFYVAAGYLLFSFFPGAPAIAPIENSHLTERLTELVVIISLMGAGLKLDRPFDLRGWTSTWRLLAVTLPLTWLLVVVLGWGYLGLLPATAVLLGAVVAPTDPVLASGVDSGPPLTELEEEDDPEFRWGTVRFSLTSEAGLNDGLAFPLTYLAIAAATASAAEGWLWLGEWVLFDVLYRVVAGVAVGYLVGQLMARSIFGAPATRRLAEVMAGAEALSTTFIAYGVTELLHGYGFIAVFVAALELRHFEWEHEYYGELYDFAVVTERLLISTVLVLFGGAIAGGLLAPLTVEAALAGLAVVFVIRPATGLLAFLGSPAPWPDRLAIAFFGIRGIGSFYYLSFALAQSSFQQLELVLAAEELWAFVGFVVLASITIHGISAAPAMTALDRWRARRGVAVPGSDD